MAKEREHYLAHVFPQEKNENPDLDPKLGFLKLFLKNHDSWPLVYNLKSADPSDLEFIADILQGDESDILLDLMAHPELLNRLYRTYRSGRHQANEPFYPVDFAALTGNFDLYKNLFDQMPHFPNYKYISFQPNFLAVVWGGNIEIMKFLKEKGPTQFLSRNNTIDDALKLALTRDFEMFKFTLEWWIEAKSKLQLSDNLPLSLLMNAIDLNDNAPAAVDYLTEKFPEFLNPTDPSVIPLEKALALAQHPIRDRLIELLSRKMGLSAEEVQLIAYFQPKPENSQFVSSYLRKDYKTGTALLILGPKEANRKKLASSGWSPVDLIDPITKQRISLERRSLYNQSFGEFYSWNPDHEVRVLRVVPVPAEDPIRWIVLEHDKALLQNLESIMKDAYLRGDSIHFHGFTTHQALEWMKKLSQFKKSPVQPRYISGAPDQYNFWTVNFGHPKLFLVPEKCISPHPQSNKFRLTAENNRSIDFFKCTFLSHPQDTVLGYFFNYENALKVERYPHHPFQDGFIRAQVIPSKSFKISVKDLPHLAEKVRAEGIHEVYLEGFEGGKVQISDSTWTSIQELAQKADFAFGPEARSQIESLIKQSPSSSSVKRQKNSKDTAEKLQKKPMLQAQTSSDTAPPSTVSDPAARLEYREVHYFLFDFNLDAIPAILKASSEKFLKKSAPELAHIKTRVTVIHPEQSPPHFSIVPSAVDQNIDQDLLNPEKNQDLAKFLGSSARISIEVKKQSEIPPLGKIPGIIRIFIGETVNCGATSRFTRNIHRTSGDGNDELTAYHLKNLAWARRNIFPDLILSENHTFPEPLRIKIAKILNPNQQSEGPRYTLQYEKIHHASYTQEVRNRLYMVASLKVLPDGYPLPEAVSEGIREDARSRVYSNPPIRPISKFQNENSGNIIPLTQTQSHLLQDILAHYATALQTPGDSTSLQLGTYKNKITLVHKGRPYFLSIDVAPEYGISQPGLVFFNATTGDIRIINHRALQKTGGTWLQTRFWSDLQNRTCRTITSLDSEGILIWGETDRRLSAYELARVHGCTKGYSQILQHGFSEINPQFASAGIGHYYSTKVVSRLLTSTLLKYTASHVYSKKNYPHSFPYFQVSSQDDLSHRIQSRKIPDTQLQATTNDQVILTDLTSSPLRPHMRWVPADSVVEVLGAMDDLREQSAESENVLDFPTPWSPENGAIHSLFGKQIDDSTESIFQEKLQQLQQSSKTKTILYPYQADGVRWLLNQRLLEREGGILADDMGLGKTLQTVAYIGLVHQILKDSPIPDRKPILIVSPVKVVHIWREELINFLPELEHQIQIIPSCQMDFESFLKNQSHLQRKKSIILTSKEVVTNCIHQFMKIEYDTVILDEAQHMHSPTSHLSTEMKNLRAGVRFALTGTPLQNSPNDLLNLLSWISPDTFQPNETKKQTNLTQEEVIALRDKAAPYLLRRTKEELSEKGMIQIGHKKIETRFIALNSLQTKIYHLLKQLELQKIKEKAPQSRFVSHAQIWSLFTLLSEVCDHPRILNEDRLEKIIPYLTAEEKAELNLGDSEKIKELLKIVTGRYQKGYDDRHRRPILGYDPSRDRPILIFSRFNLVLQLIKDRLAQPDVELKSEILNGTLTAEEVLSIQRRFKEGEIPVLLINLQVGEGQNLQKADLAILFDPWWNPQKERQAEDRIHRIGQASDVKIIKFIAQDTVENQNVLIRQNEKRALFDQLIHGKIPAPPDVAPMEVEGADSSEHLDRMESSGLEESDDQLGSPVDLGHITVEDLERLLEAL